MSSIPRFVSPPVDQLNSLRQPLTKGELLVFDFFNKHLSKKWEIYLQPHLNGLRPDFVLLNPDVGIAVFEVKDWDLDAMDYWVEERHVKSPILFGRKDGKCFSLQNQNPVEKIIRYREEIRELYCPRLDLRASFAVITSGIIFPYAKDEKVSDLLSPCLNYRSMSNFPHYNPVSGSDSIQAGNIEKVFPESARARSYFMDEDKAKDLRNWLIEPDFSSTQRQPIDLDKRQLSFVKTRTASGYRRIKGPAGSGKSLILAARAAELINEGKEVLVVTYNITLLHYLMDIAVRWPTSSGRTKKDITWLNFHYWCKRVCQESDHMEEYKALWSDSGSISSKETDSNNILKELLPDLVSTIIDDDTEKNISRYDAILVDEGQDFLPNWWNVLRKACHKDGEMLLVADDTQDIYDNARAWTDDAMIGAGFPGGNWSQLKISYRLPPSALIYARSFAEKFLPHDTTDLPEMEQMELEMYPCNLRWVHTNIDNALRLCTQEIFSMAPSADPELLAIPDITFLTGNQRFGLEVVKEINKRGVNCIHTFEGDTQDSRRKKIGFYMGDSRIKATTLHSFKGWESKALVIFVDKNVSKNSLTLLYIGITRLKKQQERSYLTVVSCAQDLQEYGRTWPDYEEIF